MAATRERLVEVAMRLFGERGYAATTVAQIEAAAGLSPGAGGLYAHFRSKEALLHAALESILTPADELMSQMATDSPAPMPTPREGAPSRGELREQLEKIARAGLARLRHDRDFNRILVRDLRAVPELLQMSVDREIRPVHDRLAAFLSQPHISPPAGVDVDALAAVLIGATSHFWLMSDIFGEHPAQVTEDAYIAVLVELASALLTVEEKT